MLDRLIIPRQTQIFKFKSNIDMEQSTSHIAPEVLAAQKAYKQSKDALKNKIKEMAAAQKELSAELRKPHGSISNAGMAQASRRLNRIELHHYYMAYAMLRVKHGGYTKGLKAGSIKGLDDKRIDKILKQYEPKTVPYSED